MLVRSNTNNKKKLARQLSIFGDLPKPEVTRIDSPELLEEVARAIAGKEISYRNPPIWKEWIEEAQEVINIVERHITATRDKEEYNRQIKQEEEG